jgi:hypothetical protein
LKLTAIVSLPLLPPWTIGRDHTINRLKGKFATEPFDVDRARRCSFLTVIPKPISADTFVVQIEYYLPAEKRMVLRPLYS